MSRYDDPPTYEYEMRITSIKLLWWALLGAMGWGLVWAFVCIAM